LRFLSKQVAVCPNDNTIQIYAVSGKEFTLEATLKEHDHLVTGLDWAHQTNRIVSCSQDRNAYVWTFEGGSWKPVLVILRLNRAATWVRWSPNENKFAVSSGQKVVSVCYFEEDNDWWVSKHIKKHRSTVTQCEWNPNNSMLATSSTDCVARVFSAHIRGVDKGPPQNPWGKKAPFGEILHEVTDHSGWVQGVAWSPSGGLLASVAQDSTVCITDISSGNPYTQKIVFNDRPFADCIFANETTLVCVGHDTTPVIYAGSPGNFAFSKKTDEGQVKAAAKTSNASAARNMFQSKVERGGSASSSTTLTTSHQNFINCVSAYKPNNGNCTQFSTSGVDGNICVWNL
jgi:actin related protein 2/3 complex, subunit 1A/1B